MPNAKPQAADQPTVEIVEVSPAIAEDWLARNPNNRNLRRVVVGSYACDMEAGRWIRNDKTVKFSADGHLFDGQHRVNAVIASR